jgi:hypothetical protein
MSASKDPNSNIAAFGLAQAAAAIENLERHPSLSGSVQGLAKVAGKDLGQAQVDPEAANHMVVIGMTVLRLQRLARKKIAQRTHAAGSIQTRYRYRQGRRTREANGRVSIAPQIARLQAESKEGSKLGSRVESYSVDEAVNDGVDGAAHGNVASSAAHAASFHDHQLMQAYANSPHLLAHRAATKRNEKRRDAWREYEEQQQRELKQQEQLEQLQLLRRNREHRPAHASSEWADEDEKSKRALPAGQLMFAIERTVHVHQQPAPQHVSHHVQQRFESDAAAHYEVSSSSSESSEDEEGELGDHHYHHHHHCQPPLSPMRSVHPTGSVTGSVSGPPVLSPAVMNSWDNTGIQYQQPLYQQHRHQQQQQQHQQHHHQHHQQTAQQQHHHHQQHLYPAPTRASDMRPPTLENHYEQVFAGTPSGSSAGGASRFGGVAAAAAASDNGHDTPPLSPGKRKVEFKAGSKVDLILPIEKRGSSQINKKRDWLAPMERPQLGKTLPEVGMDHQENELVSALFEQMHSHGAGVELAESSRDLEIALREYSTARTDTSGMLTHSLRDQIKMHKVKKPSKKKRANDNSDDGSTMTTQPKPVQGEPPPGLVEEGELMKKSCFIFSPKCRRGMFKVSISRVFEGTVFLAIVASIIMLILENQFDVAHYWWWFMMDIILAVVFVWESVTKIIAYGFISTEAAYMRDTWNVLDFVIVLCAISNISATIALGNVGKETDDTDAAQKSLKVVVTLRALKVLRTLRLVRRVPGMRLVVAAFMSAFGPAIQVMLLFLLLMGVFAILGAGIFGGKFDRCSDPLFPPGAHLSGCVGSLNRTFHSELPCYQLKTQQLALNEVLESQWFTSEEDTGRRRILHGEGGDQYAKVVVLDRTKRWREEGRAQWGEWADWVPEAFDHSRNSGQWRVSEQWDTRHWQHTHGQRREWAGKMTKTTTTRPYVHEYLRDQRLLHEAGRRISSGALHSFVHLYVSSAVAAGVDWDIRAPDSSDERVVAMEESTEAFGLIGRALSADPGSSSGQMAQCVFEVDRHILHSDLNFDNFHEAFYTLFVISTLDSWVDIMYQAIDGTGDGKQPKYNNNKPASLYFVVYVILGVYVTVNIIVGVICDHFQRQREGLQGAVFLTDKQKAWWDTQQLLNKQRRPIRLGIEPKGYLHKLFFQLSNSDKFDQLVYVLIILCTHTVYSYCVLILCTHYTHHLILQVPAHLAEHAHDGDDLRGPVR